MHRAEVTEASEKQFRTQILLDAIAEKPKRPGLAGRADAVPRAVRRPVRHGAAASSSRRCSENNQLPRWSARSPATRRSRSRSARSIVVDTNGKPVDLTGFVAVEDEDDAEDEVVEEAEEIADAAAEADAIIEAEETPKPKAPAEEGAGQEGRSESSRHRYDR